MLKAKDKDEYVPYSKLALRLNRGLALASPAAFIGSCEACLSWDVSTARPEPVIPWPAATI